MQDRAFIPIALCLVFAYFPIFSDLLKGIWGNELVRHAPLVFILAVYLAYRVRFQWYHLVDEGNTAGPVHFFLAGIALNIVGQILGIFILAQLSLPVTLYGLVLYLKGRRPAALLIFPVFFLVLAFPIPGKLYWELMAPLKLFVSKASAGCLQILGYDVIRQGNILTIGALDLGVTDACSGLNSLMAIMTLSVFYGYLMIRQVSFRIIVAVTMIPLVMVANIFRVTASSIMAVAQGQEVAFGRFHYLWGVLVFSVCVLGLMALTRILARIEQKRNDSA